MRFELSEEEIKILERGEDITRAGNVVLFGRPVALVVEVNGPQASEDFRRESAAGIAPATPDPFWMSPPRQEIDGGRQTFYNRPTRASGIAWMRQIEAWRYSHDDAKATARLIRESLEALETLDLRIASHGGEAYAGDGALFFPSGYAGDARAKLLIILGQKKLRYLVGPWRLDDPADRLELFTIDGPVEAVGDVLTSGRSRTSYPTLEELRAWLQEIHAFAISTPRARNNSTALLRMLDELEAVGKGTDEDRARRLAATAVRQELRTLSAGGADEIKREIERLVLETPLKPGEWLFRCPYDGATATGPSDCERICTACGRYMGKIAEGPRADEDRKDALAGLEGQVDPELLEKAKRGELPPVPELQERELTGEESARAVKEAIERLDAARRTVAGDDVR